MVFFDSRKKQQLRYEMFIQQRKDIHAKIFLILVYKMFTVYK